MTLYPWLPEETQESPLDENWEADAESEPAPDIDPDASTGLSKREIAAGRRDYDVEHYLNVLVTSYAARLRKAFSPEDFEQLFRLDQPGLFDQPIESIEPRWIRCQI